jgi:hypothetical protein
MRTACRRHLYTRRRSFPKGFAGSFGTGLPGVSRKKTDLVVVVADAGSTAGKAGEFGGRTITETERRNLAGLG